MTQAKLTPVPLGDFPVGTILSFSGTLDLDVLQKAGWLYCNGDHISRARYAGLFAVIGTANGDGDGHSTFTLPDLRGTFLRGVDGGSKNDPDATSRASAGRGGNTGDRVGSVQAHDTGRPATDLLTDDPGSHRHAVSHIPADNSSADVNGSYQRLWDNSAGKTTEDGQHIHYVNAGGDKESRPTNVSSYFIIKYAQV